MTEERNPTNNGEHSIHESVSHAKKVLKSLHDNQTELDKNNPEYQDIKEQLTQLLDIGADELTPQEFTTLVTLTTKAQEMIVIKSKDIKTDV